MSTQSYDYNKDVKREILLYMPYQKLLTLITGLLKGNKQDQESAEKIIKDKVLWYTRAEKDFGVEPKKFLEKVTEDKAPLEVYDDYETTNQVIQVLILISKVAVGIKSNFDRSIDITNLKDYESKLSAVSNKVKAKLNDFPLWTGEGRIGPDFVLKTQKIVYMNVGLPKSHVIKKDRPFAQDMKLMDAVKKYTTLNKQKRHGENKLDSYFGKNKLYSYLGEPIQYGILIGYTAGYLLDYLGVSRDKFDKETYKILRRAWS